SPEKTVILPDMDAGCSLEDSCPPDQFAAFRNAHPDHIALTYINCSAEVKALSDIIVTSSSAQIILDQIPKDQKIIFGPDRHLGGYLARKTGRDMLLWPGICIVHQAFSEGELLKLKAQYPGVPGGDGNCNCNMCPYMALNTLEKLYVALRDLQPRIEMSTELMDAARKPLQRMLDMAGGTVGKGDVGMPVLSEDEGPVLSEDE